MSESGRRPTVSRSDSSAKLSPAGPPPSRTAATPAREPRGFHRKPLTGPPPPGPDHQRRPPGDHILELYQFQLAGLADLVGRCRRARRRLGLGRECTASLAVVGAVCIGEAALWTVLGHRDGR